MLIYTIAKDTPLVNPDPNVCRVAVMAVKPLKTTALFNLDSNEMNQQAEGEKVVWDECHQEKQHLSEQQAKQE